MSAKGLNGPNSSLGEGSWKFASILSLSDSPWHSVPVVAASLAQSMPTNQPNQGSGMTGGSGGQGGMGPDMMGGMMGGGQGDMGPGMMGE